MTGEDIFGLIISVSCAWGCAGLFYGIGVWASKRKDPMHFWAGTTVDPKTITDVPAYNQANARMWKQFSIPFWLSGLLAFGTLIDERFNIAYTALLCAGSFGGAIWLLLRYLKISRQYSK